MRYALVLLLLVGGCKRKIDLDSVPPAPIDPSAPMPVPPLPDGSGTRDLSVKPVIGPSGIVTTPKTP